MFLNQSKRQEKDKNLQEYYKNEFGGSLSLDHEELLNHIQMLKINQEQFNCLQEENKLRTDEVVKLQRALSDAQVALVQEQQKSLQLQSQVDNYKIREAEDRNRYTQLLQKTKMNTPYSRFSSFKSNYQNDANDEDLKFENKTLKVKITALEAEIEEHNEVYVNMYNTFTFDRQAMIEEAIKLKESEQDARAGLLQELNKVKELAYQNIRELVELKKSYKLKESEMEKMKEDFKNEIESIESSNNNVDLNQSINSNFSLDISQNKSPFSNHPFLREKKTYSIHDYMKKIQSLKKALKHKEKEFDDYKIQASTLEESYKAELEQIKEEYEKLSLKNYMLTETIGFKLKVGSMDFKIIHSDLKVWMNYFLKKNDLNEDEQRILNQIQFLESKIEDMIDGLMK